jgi:2-oxoglutarate ferredoxin oxidoreductase subunit beta
MLHAAYEHEGSALIEIYQNCNVFNDKAFIQVTGKEERVHNRINLEQGKPIVFDEGAKAIMMRDGQATVVDSASVDPAAILVHDPGRPDPSISFALSRLSHGPYGPTPIGIFRSIKRPTYDSEVAKQVAEATERLGPGDISTLIASHGTWTVDGSDNGGGA